MIEIIRDLRYHSYAEVYRKLMGRRGVAPSHAANVVRAQPTVFGALMVRRGEADAMVCGTSGRFRRRRRWRGTKPENSLAFTTT